MGFLLRKNDLAYYIKIVTEIIFGYQIYLYHMSLFVLQMHWNYSIVKRSYTLKVRYDQGRFRQKIPHV